MKLGELCEINMGQSPKSEHYNTDGQGLPFLQGNRTFGTKYPTFDTYTTSTTKIAEAGDVIMSVRAPVGDVNITPVKMCLGRGVCSLRHKEGQQEFLYYLMRYYALELINRESGTVFGSVNRNDIANLEINVPSISEQIEIGKILGTIDDKIINNTKINHHLEQTAQAIFKNWFVDFEPWGGVMPEKWQESTLGRFVDIKRGGSPRPIQDFLSNTGYNWLKISDVTALQSPFVLEIKEHIKEEGVKKTVFLKSGSIVLSNSATPGIPKILCVDTCIHDGWLYFPSSYFSNEFLYLFFKYIRQDLIKLGNGSVFTNLKTDILKNYAAIIPDEKTLLEFDKIIVPLFLKMECFTRESAYLVDLRDTLLPRLMSGELSVSDIGSE